MKLKLSFLIIMLILIMNACTLNRMVAIARDQSIVVTPEPIIRENNKLSFTVTVAVPSSLIKQSGSYFMNVFLDWEQGELALTPIPIKKENPGDINHFGSKAYSIPYDPKYEGGTIMVQGLLIDKDRFMETDKMAVGKVVGG